MLAIDARPFPQITVDVAVPERERARDLPPEAFSLPGLTDVGVEELDPADLTLAVVLDDGPEVRTPGLAFQQGSATELMRTLPPDIEVMIFTTSGVATDPTVDRNAAIDAIGSSRPRSTSGTLAGAAADAAQRLETVTDGRRQLVVMTGEASDIPGDEATSLLASLDRANAAMRVVSMGDTVGPHLMQAANDSGGAAAAVGWGSDAALRAVDVLSTTFAEQYRLRGTMAAPGPVTVRLTVDGRSYEATIPDVGVAPTTSTTGNDADDRNNGRRRHGSRNSRGQPDDGAWRADELGRGIINACRRGQPGHRRAGADRRRRGHAAQTQPASRSRTRAATSRRR